MAEILPKEVVPPGAGDDPPVPPDPTVTGTVVFIVCEFNDITCPAPPPPPVIIPDKAPPPPPPAAINRLTMLRPGSAVNVPEDVYTANGNGSALRKPSPQTPFASLATNNAGYADAYVGAVGYVMLCGEDVEEKSVKVPLGQYIPILVAPGGAVNDTDPVYGESGDEYEN
jgi:hypothetical protein